MARRMQAEATISASRVYSEMDWVDPDELKITVRDLLASMTTADRQICIQNLERDLRFANLNMRAYLLPIGVSATSPEELTPSDVGHLVRYLKINVPCARCVVDGFIARLSLYETERCDLQPSRRRIGGAVGPNKRTRVTLPAGLELTD